MDDLDRKLDALSNALRDSTRSAADMRHLQRLIESTTELVSGGASSLDVKIASLAIGEMTRAFDMFAPYRDRQKVTIFGSARTTVDNPIYAVTVDAARRLSRLGFMVVTGAGPGLMEAGMLGAGRENSIGVSIRLPFETGANSVIAGDEKYVSMRYFFTRKLMLVKESHAFLCMPGGFGTLDETFELLTLAQTAKSVPIPIVFLEVPGDPFWTPMMKTLEPLLLNHGLISPNDTGLYRITDDIDVAVEHVTAFYANYHSIRFVKDKLHIRIRRPIPDRDFAALAVRFAGIALDGVIEQTTATQTEIADDDNLDLVRVAMYYTGKGFAELLPFIDALNKY